MLDIPSIISLEFNETIPIFYLVVVLVAYLDFIFPFSFLCTSLLEVNHFNLVFSSSFFSLESLILQYEKIYHTADISSSFLNQ
jgi:hypothetical protein